jgi:hypothetical protein
MEILKFIISLKNFFEKYFREQNNIISEITNKIGGEAKGILCKKIYTVICILIIYIVVLYLFIYSFVLTCIFIHTNFINLFKVNKSLEDDICALQMKNTYHITDYLSVEKNMLSMFILILLSFICIFYLYAYNGVNSHTTWPYLIIFILVSFKILLVYFIIYYSTISRISARNYNLLNNIYSYINYDYLNNGGVCNYLDKNKSKLINPNYDFIEGKCNNIDASNTNLKRYILAQIVAMSTSVNITDPEVSKETLKNIKDSKGIKYYDKIINAIMTHALAYYLNSEKSKEFFSLSNILNGNFIEQLFKFRINPFLYIQRDNINILTYSLPQNLIDESDYPVMVLSSDENTQIDNTRNDINQSNLIKYIKHDYDNIKNILTNNIIDYVNLTDSLTPSAYCYILIMLIGLILFIVNYYKSA